MDKLRPVKSWTLSFEDSANYYNIFPGGGASGQCFTRTTHKINFSAGISYTLPDSLTGRDLRIYIDCAARRSRDNVGALVLTLNKGDAAKFWTAFKANDYLGEINKWERIKDSTQIPAETNNEKGITLLIYGWNSSQDSSYFDLDDLQIRIKEVQTVKR